MEKRTEFDMENVHRIYYFQKFSLRLFELYIIPQDQQSVNGFVQIIKMPDCNCFKH